MAIGMANRGDIPRYFATLRALPDRRKDSSFVSSKILNSRLMPMFSSISRAVTFVSPSGGFS